MELNDHSLRQMDEDAIRKLPEPAVRDLAVRLLNDLKEARERFEPKFSEQLRPPGRDAPWSKSGRTVRATATTLRVRNGKRTRTIRRRVKLRPLTVQNLPK